MAEFKIGQTVEINDGRKGVVKFIGDIHVADGQFLGIELPTPAGKNDGSVKGERYFECAANHGLFVRPSGIARVLQQPAPKPASKPQPKPTAQPPKPRPSSIGIGKSALKPTPATKPAAPTSTAASNPNRLSRPSIAPPSMISKAPSRKSSVPSTGSVSTASATRRTSTLFNPPPKSTTALRSISSSSTTQPPKSTLKDTNVDNLETKIRHLEKQHGEHREKLKKLDTLQQERDRFEGIIQKLQSKCQAFHSDNSELKTQLKKAEAEVERLSRDEQEHESILELATLDREMAEEKAEAAEAESDMLKQRLEEQELELDILRSEAEMYTKDMSEEDREAAGFYRLQSEYDRVKDALLLLREVTQQTEAQLRGDIQNLEKDLVEFDRCRQGNGELKARLADREEIISDLRQQLDAAAEWEDMVEELSDQNQHFKEQLAEKDLAISDLENIKELNDELERHHVEHEAELREELEARDVELAEHARKVAQQDAAIADQGLLLSKFRDLVVDLQGKMSNVESSKMMSEEQTKDVTNRFNEVMDLNRKLRNAAAVTIGTTITAGLQKLGAEESREELDIVKHYLPESADRYHSDALRAYFRFKRVGFKSLLIHGLVKNQELNRSDMEASDIPNDDLLRYEILQQLTELSLHSERAWSSISSCTLVQFDIFGPAFHDLEPVERTLDFYLECLKKDEVKHEEVIDQLRRSLFVMETVSEQHADTLDARPEDEYILRVSMIKLNMEALEAVFRAVKSYLQTLDLADNETVDLIGRFSSPMNEIRQNAMVAEKLLRALQTLRADSLYPRSLGWSLDDVFDQDTNAQQLVQTARKFAREYIRFVSTTTKDHEGPVSARDLANQLLAMQSSYFPNDDISSVGMLQAKLNYWHDHASNLMNNVEIQHGPAPWILKAQEIEAAKKQTAEVDEKLRRLTLEHQTTVLQIREREEIIDTKELEIEHLKAKHREAATKVEDLERLQSELKQAESERRRLQQEIKTQQAEIQSLKERPLAPERHDPVEVQPATASAANNTQSDRVEPPRGQNGTFTTFVQALSNENHWLRRRENREMFSINLRATLNRMREARIAKEKKAARLAQRKADDILGITLRMEKLDLKPSKAPKASVTDVKSVLDPKRSAPSLDVPTLIRPRSRPPILLTPLKSPLGWQPLTSTPASHISEMEDWTFEDLSPVSEEFPGDGDEELEGFSELGEITLHAIVERATWRN
ncbi:hypothetical protein K469DRAFT_721510 [Zopfia rhizophila CBS 207.26]|uniref:CAP-Gly domain-containing protein n=1 Tax=Zopfia rhizophila CBS 207.26 TaxID=1314779 RepID=A0A6A6EFV7_9PEZI|nr:hypothetical protein K469DRAFT_721510 [Zopfia rhizophila CBS 207.26]